MRAVQFGVLAVMFLGVSVASAGVATFEEFSGPPYALGPESFYNGSDLAGGFVSGGASFNNSFIDFGGGFSAWQGWAVSNTTDTATPGYGNQYSAYAPPADGPTLYGVAFSSSPGDAHVEFPDGAVLQSVEVTNTTYAALAMRDGDAFSKKFGGVSGNDPDYFKLVITGLSPFGAPLGSIEFYLADFRFADNTLDYIVDTWTSVDLSPLVGARRLSLSFESSDVGAFGINTPAYAAFDNLIWTPEPGALALLLTVAAMQRRRG